MAFIVGLADPFTLFLLLPWASPKEYVVDKSILQECQEHEDEAAHEINIDSLDVRDLGESLTQMGVDGSHCKYRGDPCKERVCALLPSFLKCHSQLPHPSFQLDNLRRDGSSATGNKIVIILSQVAQYKSLQKINQLPTVGQNVKAEYHQDDGDQHPLDLILSVFPDPPSFPQCSRKHSVLLSVSQPLLLPFFHFMDSSVFLGYY